MEAVRSMQMQCSGSIFLKDDLSSAYDKIARPAALQLRYEMLQNVCCIKKKIFAKKKIMCVDIVTNSITIFHNCDIYPSINKLEVLFYDESEIRNPQISWNPSVHGKNRCFNSNREFGSSL